jgi:hypothetical protein
MVIGLTFPKKTAGAAVLWLRLRPGQNFLHWRVLLRRVCAGALRCVAQDQARRAKLDQYKCSSWRSLCRA